MLRHKKDLALGIGRFTLNDIWKDSFVPVNRALKNFYGTKDCTKFSPEVNEMALSQEILSIPSLQELHQQVMDLKKEGYCAIFIDKFGLRSFLPEERNKLLFAFSLALGFPTPTDPHQGQLLWDVKARSLPKGTSRRFPSTAIAPISIQTPNITNALKIIFSFMW